VHSDLSQWFVSMTVWVGREEWRMLSVARCPWNNCTQCSRMVRPRVWPGNMIVRRAVDICRTELRASCVANPTSEYYIVWTWQDSHSTTAMKWIAKWPSTPQRRNACLRHCNIRSGHDLDLWPLTLKTVTWWIFLASCNKIPSSSTK